MKASPVHIIQRPLTFRPLPLPLLLISILRPLKPANASLAPDASSLTTPHSFPHSPVMQVILHHASTSNPGIPPSSLMQVILHQASTSNPGIPPSSLMSFLRHKPEIAVSHWRGVVGRCS